ELNKYAFYDMVQNNFDLYYSVDEYDYMDYLEELSGYLNGNDFIYEALDNLEEYYFIDEWEDVLNAILNKLGFKLVRFNVDRSSTCDAIASIDFCDDFIIDLGSGENFYTITQYDENGDILDSLSECYIKDETDLKECINEYFNNGSDHINIID